MDKNNILKSSIFILILSNSGNFINFIFNILLSKYLQANEYSLFTSLSSFYIALLTPFSGLILLLQLKINKFKNDENQLNIFVLNISKLFLSICIVFFIIFIFFNNWIISNFKTTYSIIFIFYLFFAISLFSVIPISILNSFKRYYIPHFSNLVNDLLRISILLSAIFITSLKFNIFLGAVFATFCALFGHLIINSYKAKYFININLKNLLNSFSLSQIIDYPLIKTFLFMGALSILLNLDLVFSRIFYDEVISANYNFASFISKSIYFLPSVLFSFIFNEQINKNRNSIHGVFLIILINLIGCFIVIFVFNYFVDFFYDGEFDFAKQPIKYLAPSMVLLSMIILYFNKLLSQNNYTFLVFMIISSLTFIILSTFYHSNINSIAINLLISISILYIHPLKTYAFKSK